MPKEDFSQGKVDCSSSGPQARLEGGLQICLLCQWHTGGPPGGEMRGMWEEGKNLIGNCTKSIKQKGK